MRESLIRADRAADKRTVNYRVLELGYADDTESAGGDLSIRLHALPTGQTVASFLVAAGN